MYFTPKISFQPLSVYIFLTVTFVAIFAHAWGYGIAGKNMDFWKNVLACYEKNTGDSVAVLELAGCGMSFLTKLAGIAAKWVIAPEDREPVRIPIRSSLRWPREDGLVLTPENLATRIMANCKEASKIIYDHGRRNLVSVVLLNTAKLTPLNELVEQLMEEIQPRRSPPTVCGIPEIISHAKAALPGIAERGWNVGDLRIVVAELNLNISYAKMGLIPYDNNLNLERIQVLINQIEPLLKEVVVDNTFSMPPYTRLGGLSVPL